MSVTKIPIPQLISVEDHLPMNSKRITGMADPTGAQDAATKQYVDNAIQGLDIKASVKAATTANITLASPGATIDGVSLSNGDRVLVKSQTTASENGVYLFNGASSAMTRAADFDAWSELPGSFVFVEQGSVNADTGWVCTVDSGGTLGTTAVTFVQFSGAGSYSAGNGLSLSGSQFSANLDAGGGLEFNNGATRIKLDAATIARSASGIKVAAGGISTTELADNSVTAAKIASAVAGNGLTGGGGSALAVGAGAGITVAADAVAVDSAAVPFFEKAIRQIFTSTTSPDYTLTYTPVQSHMMWVFYSGVLMTPTEDYSISGVTLSFEFVPVAGKNIVVIYFKG